MSERPPGAALFPLPGQPRVDFHVGVRRGFAVIGFQLQLALGVGLDGVDLQVILDPDPVLSAVQSLLCQVFPDEEPSKFAKLE